MPLRTHRHWTPAQKRRVLRYYQKYGHTPTLERYSLASSVLSRWKQDAQANGGDMLPKKTGPKPFGRRTEAIIHLERWSAARLAFIRAGGTPAAYDLDGELALRSLRGER